MSGNSRSSIIRGLQTMQYLICVVRFEDYIYCFTLMGFIFSLIDNAVCYATTNASSTALCKTNGEQTSQWHYPDEMVRIKHKKQYKHNDKTQQMFTQHELPTKCRNYVIFYERFSWDNHIMVILIYWPEKYIDTISYILLRRQLFIAYKSTTITW